jgi:hypothetical protein
MKPLLIYELFKTRAGAYSLLCDHYLFLFTSFLFLDLHLMLFNQFNVLLYTTPKLYNFIPSLTKTFFLSLKTIVCSQAVHFTVCAQLISKVLPRVAAQRDMRVQLDLFVHQTV